MHPPRKKKPNDAQVAGMALALKPSQNIVGALANALALRFGLGSQESRDYAHRMTSRSYAQIIAVGRQEVYALTSQTELECPDCAAVMHLEGSDRGLSYRCSASGCTGNHGAHPDGAPLGKPADQLTRRARIEAHRALNTLWANTEERMEVYTWLAKAMRMSKEECHIANFDAPTCRRVVELASRTDAAFIHSSN